MVTLHRFSSYDIGTDEVIVSRRWGTREAIMRIGGTVLEDTAVEVGEAMVNWSGIEGLTTRDFNPHDTGGIGFQSYVNP